MCFLPLPLISDLNPLNLTSNGNGRFCFLDFVLGRLLFHAERIWTLWAFLLSLDARFCLRCDCIQHSFFRYGRPERILLGLRGFQ